MDYVMHLISPHYEILEYYRPAFIGIPHKRYLTSIESLDVKIKILISPFLEREGFIALEIKTRLRPCADEYSTCVCTHLFHPAIISVAKSISGSDKRIMVFIYDSPGFRLATFLCERVREKIRWNYSMPESNNSRAWARACEAEGY